MTHDVPSDWEVHPVRDLVSHAASGPSPTCEERNIHGDREWGLLKTTAVTWDGWDSRAHKLLPREYWGNHSLEVRSQDVIVTKAGPRHRVGVVAHVDRSPARLIVSGKMVLLRPDPKRVIPKVLAGLLSLPASQRYLDERTTGMAESQVNFANGALLSCPLAVPPGREQQRIADVLDALDERILWQGQIVEKLRLRRAGLVEGLLAEVTVAESRLGDQLLHSPKNGYSPKETDEWTGVQALGLGCLTDAGFVPRQLKHVPRQAGRNTAALLTDGDLLMSRANTRDLVGLAGIYRSVGTPCIYPDLMMRLTPKPECRSKFLELVLRSAAVRRQIQAISQGTSESMVKVSGASVQKLLVQVPELHEQDRVITIVDALTHEIKCHDEERRKSSLLKQGVIEDLLTGRRRVA
ncbi:restriction endonuclease subunit S [Streptomyces sp. NPDC093225]|uniref:restriction endonuclease subunit S n=1 Tax=Streptomyces sp. NPDC093225 TaxID=3366034 RepID=UPI003817CF5E